MDASEPTGSGPAGPGDRSGPGPPALDDIRARIRHLLVTGDNRLKQGGGATAVARARESWEAALALAREAGLEERVRPLVELRLEAAERLV